MKKVTSKDLIKLNYNELYAKKQNNFHQNLLRSHLIFQSLEKLYFIKCCREKSIIFK